MSTAYKVLKANGEKRLPAKDDRPELAIHEYELEGIEKPVERVAKLSTPVPAVGSMIELDIEETKWGLRGKVPQRQDGFRRRDPNETRQIVRQHSQEMAMRFVAIKASLGKVSNFTFGDVARIADAFDRDVNGTPPPTSDVPADTEGLPTVDDTLADGEEIPF